MIFYIHSCLACDDEYVSGLPSKLSSREELATVLAVTIFTSTAQHAATNNGQVLNIYTLRHCPAVQFRQEHSALCLLHYHHNQCLLVSSLTGVPGYPTPPAP